MPTDAATPLNALWWSAAGLFIFFWASGFVAAKYGFPYAEPFTFLGIRFVVSSVVLAAICGFWKIGWPTEPRRYLHMVVAGLLLQSFYLVGAYYGIYLGVSTGVIALIVGFQPLLTGVLAGRLVGERVGLAQWLGLVLGFAGLAMVVADRVQVAGALDAGLAMGAFGLVSITLGTLYQKRFCADIDVRCSVVVHNVASCGVMFALAGAFETMAVDWTGAFVFAVLWTAFGLSVLAFGLFYWLVRSGATARVTSLMYLSPPTTAVMGWLAFHETLAPLALAGMAVTVAGVALATR